MFNKLFTLVQNQENKNGCPAIICGAWFNTYNVALDVEYWNNGKCTAGFIFDNEDLENFLTAAGIDMETFKKELYK